MFALYPTVYRDVHGEENIVIENDGQTLRMVVRGVEFTSKPFGSFDRFMPATENTADVSTFRFGFYGELIAAALSFDVPISVVTETVAVAGILRVTIDLEEAAGRPKDNADWADPCMTLIYPGKSYTSSGGWGSFENELLAIQKQMPVDTYMKCCFNCAFSGYSPYGNGLWGMYCHRNNKEAYVQATDKLEWIRLDEVAIEHVQETYLCTEFQRWNGETGYRDPLHVKPIETQ